MQPVEMPQDKRTVADLAGDVRGHRTLHLALFRDEHCLNSLTKPNQSQPFRDAATSDSAYITGPIVDVHQYPSHPDFLAVYVLHNESLEAVHKETHVQVESVLPEGTIQADTVCQLGR
jgi:hypothetical protein